MIDKRFHTIMMVSFPENTVLLKSETDKIQKYSRFACRTRVFVEDGDVYYSL